MEYRNISTFLRVAELRSFTQAANDLGYAQSTVTFHIHSLEQELGVPLFDRIGKTVALTPAGEYLVSYANQMVELETKIKRLSGQLESLSGTLRIGVVESLLSAYVVKHLPTYSQKYPRISIEIRTASTLDLIHMLRSNEVDLILIMSKRTVDPDLIRVFAKPAKLFFVAPSTHPLASMKEVTFQDIIGQSLILPEKISIYRQAAEDLAAQFDCILSPVVQINNTTTIIKLVKQGMGISFLPSYLVENEVDRGEFTYLNIQNASLKGYYIQLLYHKSKWVTPQMEGFSGLMKEILRGGVV